MHVVKKNGPKRLGEWGCHPFSKPYAGTQGMTWGQSCYAVGDAYFCGHVTKKGCSGIAPKGNPPFLTEKTELQSGHKRSAESTNSGSGRHGQKKQWPTCLESCANPVGVLQLGVALHRLLRRDHGENVTPVDVPDSLRYDGIANLPDQNLWLLRCVG